MPINFESIDWDDLRVFLYAARTGSLSQAARRLQVDHSTVSRRIAQLEASIGSALLTRQRSGLKLNDIGELLLRHAEKMESAVVSFHEEFNADKALVSGHVRLATMEGIASLYIAERCIDLKKTAPGVTLELVTSPQTIHVNRREADLFLSFFKPVGQGLISEKIGGFRLSLYASRAYLDTYGTPASLSDLQNHVFVSYIEDLILVDSVRWLTEAVESPTVVFHSNSMIAQMGAAAGGLGIVFLPTFSVSRHPDLVPVLPDRVTATREVWLNVHNDLQFSPRILAVRQFLKNLFRGDPGMQAV